MKQISSATLLESLRTDTRQIILQTNYLLQHDPEVLLKQPGEGKWSIAEIIEHLNSYSRYYLPLMKESIERSRHIPSAVFTPGWLGDYFTRSMLPDTKGKISNKMQSPKNHRPPHDLESKKVLEEFLKQEFLLLELLDKAAKTNLEKVRIPISISRLIKIKLGDTFRFVVAHHVRHFVQIQNTLKLLHQPGLMENQVIQ